MEWYQIKVGLTQVSGISQDALHVLVGVGIQLLLASVARRGVGSLFPWAVVLVLELANEYSDLHLEIWPDRAWQIGESAKDLLVTLLLPTVLLVLARRAPAIFGRAAAHTANEGAAEATSVNP